MNSFKNSIVSYQPDTDAPAAICQRARNIYLAILRSRRWLRASKLAAAAAARAFRHLVSNLVNYRSNFERRQPLTPKRHREARCRNPGPDRRHQPHDGVRNTSGWCFRDFGRVGLRISIEERSSCCSST